MREFFVLTHFLRRRDEVGKFRPRVVRCDPRTLVAEKILPVLERDARRPPIGGRGGAFDREGSRGGPGRKGAVGANQTEREEAPSAVMAMMAATCKVRVHRKSRQRIRLRFVD